MGQVERGIIEKVKVTRNNTFYVAGSYSYWSGTEMKKVSGTQQTFPLAFDPDGTAGSGFLDYVPVDDNGSFLRFMSEADGGLKGVSGSAVFPDKPSYNVSGNIPAFRTTQEQLASFVPYVEYIRSGTKVTGLTWRVVNPNNVSAPVAQSFRMRFRVRAVYKSGYENAYNGSNIEIAANETPEGTVTFDTPVEESEIWGIRVRLRTYETGTSSDYDWGFFKQSAPQMTLWRNHISRASITDGKSDYSDARFLSVFFDVRSDVDTVIEAKYLTDEGTFTIPGGGYSLRDDENGEELGVTIPTGTDRSYKLKVSDGTKPADDSYLAYQPVDENGVELAFSGGAEKGLNGKTVSWTFPAALNMNGSAVVPNFKSTSEQLATGAPYFEIASRDGNITAINYKIVTSSNTSTAITPSYRTDFRIYIDRKTGGNYHSSWLNNQSSGTWTLETPQAANNLERVRIRVRSYEDTSNYAVHQWNFYPAESYSTPAITTTSLPAATLNASYTATLTSNISGARWSVISGSLPAGLNLNSSTGAITGTPSAAGTSTFTVKAESGSVSAEKSLSIAVNRNSGGSTGITPLGGTSGGCESGLAISSALLLLALFVKKR